MKRVAAGELEEAPEQKRAKQVVLQHLTAAQMVTGPLGRKQVVLFLKDSPCEEETVWKGPYRAETDMLKQNRLVGGFAMAVARALHLDEGWSVAEPCGEKDRDGLKEWMRMRGMSEEEVEDLPSVYEDERWLQYPRVSCKTPWRCADEHPQVQVRENKHFKGKVYNVGEMACRLQDEDKELERLLVPFLRGVFVLLNCCGVGDVGAWNVLVDDRDHLWFIDCQESSHKTIPQELHDPLDVLFHRRPRKVVADMMLKILKNPDTNPFTHLLLQDTGVWKEELENALREHYVSQANNPQQLDMCRLFPSSSIAKKFEDVVSALKLLFVAPDSDPKSFRSFFPF